MTKKRVFSGTRATGRLHLGNYLGAVKGYIALQERPEYECLYMVMDLHTTTTPFNHKTLAADTREVIIDYLACGLDSKKAIITAQSLVPEHTYLAFLLSSQVSVARMQHLPTFKEKVKQYPGNVTMALLNYPVLMAADILVYKAELVPVGVDQEPHLEVAREIARKMNRTYGTNFPEPKRFSTKAPYVPSLQGEGKMSKGIEESYIGLNDDLRTIKIKLAKVPTDIGKGNIQRHKPKEYSEEYVKKYISEHTKESLGVAVLMEFVELFQGKEKRKEYEKQYVSKGIRYAQLKEDLAQAVYKELEPIQKKRKKLEKNKEYVDEIIREGAEKARSIAQKTLREIKEKMGLVKV